MTVVILGCGYTGERVARRMLARGARVICASRNVCDIAGAETVQLDVSAPFSLDFVPAGSLVLHSIPPLEDDDPSAIPRALGDRPARIVYLSTTGVYGSQEFVNEETPVAPRRERDHQRLRAEQAITAGPWSSLILRPAAIYGPGRGIHVSLQQGRFKLVDGGSNYVSRIHVEDLAWHVEAALQSDVTGAWPVADEAPCRSVEIAEYCAQLLAVPMPASVGTEGVHHTRRANRRVDGRGIRAKLGVGLQFPTYHEGIPAAIAQKI